MTPKRLPAISRIRELFTYSDGHLVRRKKVSGSRVGGVAGHFKRDGYRYVGIDCAYYPEHRVIWALCHGEDTPLLIDHIDGNRSNNMIENLRTATVFQNGYNRHQQKSGLKGITFHKQSGKWQAQIRASGKNIYLGLFLTEKGAANAYDHAAISMHGEFATTNEEHEA